MAAKFPPNYVYTTGDPNAAKDRPSNAAVVIKLDGGDAATDAQIEAFIAANPGTPIIFFMQEASEKIVTYSKKYNADGVIIGGESESQMSLGLDQQAGLDVLGVPKIFTTGHNYNTSAKWPPGWGVEFQGYFNDPNWRPSKENALAFLQTALSQGATSIGFAVGSWGTSTVPMSVYQETLNYLKRNGININTLSAFTWEQMTDEQKQGFLKLLSGQGVTAPQPTVSKPTIPPVPVAASPPTPPSAPPPVTPQKPPRVAPPIAGVNSQSPLQTDASSTGGYHMPASEYAGGAKVVKTIWGANGTRTDITETGAVIQTAPDGGTPRRAGWVDPNKISGFSSMDDLKGNIMADPDSNPYTRSELTRPEGVTGATADQIAESINPGYNSTETSSGGKRKDSGAETENFSLGSADGSTGGSEPTPTPAVSNPAALYSGNLGDNVNVQPAQAQDLPASWGATQPGVNTSDAFWSDAALNDQTTGGSPNIHRPGAQVDIDGNTSNPALAASTISSTGANSEELDPAIATAINSHEDSHSDRPKGSSDDDTRSRGGVTDPMGGGAGSTGGSASPTNGNGIDPYFAAQDPQSHFGGRAVD